MLHAAGAAGILRNNPFDDVSKGLFLFLKRQKPRSHLGSGLVREAGLEPARPEWTLEPESSESANSTTRAYANALATALI